MTTEPTYQRGQFVRSIAANIVLPIFTFYGLRLAGVGEVAALLTSGVWPLVETAWTVRRTRHVDELAVFVLIGLAIGVVTAVLADDARSLFFKDSIVTGLTGVVFLASLAAAPAGLRPLTFYFGRRFAAGGSDDERAWWDGLWRYPNFRRVQRLLTLMWGAALVLEAGVRAVLTSELGTAPMVVANNVVPYLVIAVLVSASIAVGRRAAQTGHQSQD